MGAGGPSRRRARRGGAGRERADPRLPAARGGLLAVSLWAQDRQGDALAALRQARKVLDDELGIDPGPALTELEDAILQQRTDLLRAALAPPASAPASHR